MKVRLPKEFNPHLYHRAPRTRIELLAWMHRESRVFKVRCLAASILCNAGVTPSALCPEPVSYPLRRGIMAKTAVRLRRELRFRRAGFGDPAHVKTVPDAASARMEAQNEGRLMPKRSPCHHG